MPPQEALLADIGGTNARFALTIDAGNEELAARALDIDDTRARGEATVPTTIGLELATNPFLRAGDADIQSALGMTGSDEPAVFAEIRSRKDNF